MAQRIEEEARALWAEVFGRAPDAAGDPHRLLQEALESQPPATYERLTLPALNRADIVFAAPRQFGSRS
jgi:hypothetical protein